MLFSKVDPPTVPAETGSQGVDEVSVRPEGRRTEPDVAIPRAIEMPRDGP